MKSNWIEGVLFQYNNIDFKGSQIGRKLSFGKLKKSYKEF